MKILIFLLLSITLLISNISPAYSQGYDTLDMTWFYKTPLVCTQETMSDIIMDKTRNAVIEWEGMMKGTEKYPKDKVVWEIDYKLVPYSELETFDYSKCDITISFWDRPENPEDQLEIVGYTFYNEESIDIEIYYEDMEYCVTRTSDSDYIYTNYDLCYNNRDIPISRLIPTVKHEFGHALGLGHFTEFNENSRSSIMTPYKFDNPRLQVIMPEDVEAVLSIYGTDGFVNEWTNPNFLWPGWMAEGLFEWYHDYKISDKEYQNAMKWYYLEAEITPDVVPEPDPQGKVVTVEIG